MRAFWLHKYMAEEQERAKETKDKRENDGVKLILL
jgi:hypothetical protein